LRTTKTMNGFSPFSHDDESKTQKTVLTTYRGKKKKSRKSCHFLVCRGTNDDMRDGIAIDHN
jgi:hypothetical protein